MGSGGEALGVFSLDDDVEETPTAFPPQPETGNTSSCYTCDRPLASLPDTAIYSDVRTYRDSRNRQHCYVLTFCAWCRRVYLDP